MENKNDKPILVERYADNGEHSHWELINESGAVIWSEPETKEPARQNKNDTLQAIKDEYARECGYDNWEGLCKIKHDGIEIDAFQHEKDINAIATRYAAKENEGLIRYVRELREASLNYLDCQFNAEDRSVAEIVNAGTELRTLLSKTAHYDKNTDKELMDAVNCVECLAMYEEKCTCNQNTDV